MCFRCFWNIPKEPKQKINKIITLIRGKNQDRFFGKKMGKNGNKSIKKNQIN